MLTTKIPKLNFSSGSKPLFEFSLRSFFQHLILFIDEPMSTVGKDNMIVYTAINGALDIGEHGSSTTAKIHFHGLEYIMVI